MEQAPDQRRRVAIACQGGGSHTAFTAGVLKGLLGTDALSRHQIVGLSGTSGGAVCALLAWYALLDDDPAAAARLLDAFWAENAATTPTDQLANAWLLWVSRLQHVVVTPAVSPYDTIMSVTGMRHFRSLLERRVDFDRIDVVDDPARPMLLLGAVDVRSGDFKAFNSRRERISPEMVLASAAIPTLFRAVRLDGRLYWDGLFSQNPPVRELLDANPDEIWVIQVNPRHRPDEPRTVVDIADRRNELSGNLSLHQELHFIEKINELLDEGLLTSHDRYRNVTVRVIELTRSRLSRALGTTSKLNRDPDFIDELVDHGVARAEEFVAALAFEDAWRRRDVDGVVDRLAEDAELVVGAPFGDAGAVRGAGQIRSVIASRLTRDITIDVTHKQVCQDAVVWSVRTSRHGDRTPEHGWATARFANGAITSLCLGADAPDRDADAVESMYQA